MEKMIDSLTIGKKTIEIEEGDYLMDNGICVQLIAGNGRLLQGNGFDRRSSIVLTKKAINSINLEEIPNRTTSIRGTLVKIYPLTVNGLVSQKKG